MTALERLAVAWDLDPTVLLGAGVAAVAWAALARPLRVGHALRFLGGMGLLVLALVSPLDVLSDEYLFSAHMFQHVVLTFAVPPLLLGGVPAAAWDRLLERPWARAIARILGDPRVALPLALGDLTLWHVPPLYDAALRSEPLHAFQHLTLLVTFTALWWPLAGPASRRLAPGAAIACLGLTAAGCSLLGVLITFAPLGTWAHYLRTDDPLGIRAVLAELLTPTEDQQLGGLIMWVASMPLLLGPVLVAVGRAFASPPRAPTAPIERREEARP